MHYLSLENAGIWCLMFVENSIEISYEPCDPSASYDYVTREEALFLS